MADKNAALRNGQADDLGARFDGGSIDLLDASSNVLATITLSDPAFGSASNGEISANGTPLSFTGTAAAGSGTDIDSADLKSSDESEEITGLTVGTSTAHIVLDNINIAEDQEGELSSFTITVPQSIEDAA